MHDPVKHVGDLAKDPSSYSYVTYLWIFFVSILGGFVRVIRNSKLPGKSWREIVWIFFSEMTVSCFVGVITFYLCELAEFKPLYTAVLTSMAGYMGGRSLTILEEVYKVVIIGGRSEK